MRHYKLFRLLIFVICIPLFIGCVFQKKFLTREDFKTFEKLAVISSHTHKPIQIMDRTNISQQPPMRYSQNVLAVAIEGVVLSVMAQKEVSNKLGGHYRELNEAVLKYPFKQIFDQKLSFMKSLYYQIVPPEELSADAKILIKKILDSPNNEELYQSMYAQYGIKTIAFIDFAHGLFIRGNLSEPTAGVCSALSVIDLQTRRVIQTKSYCSDTTTFDTSTTHSMEELIVNNGNLYKKGFFSGTKIVTQRIAFDLGAYVDEQ